VIRENLNQEAFHATMFLLDATVGVASAASGKPHAASQSAALAGAEGNAAHEVAAQESQRVSAHAMDRENWTTSTFRKTTIFPGKAAGA